MLQAIAGPSEYSPFAQPVDGRDFVRGAQADRKNLRIAYCADIAGIGVDPAVERVCRNAAFALSRNGCGVEEIQLDLSAARPAFLSLRGLWFVTHMYSRLDKQDRFGSNVANNVRSGLEVTSKEIAAAEAYRADLCRQYPSAVQRIRSSADSVRCRSAVPGRAELSRHHRGQADEDLHRLDRAHIRAEPDGAASGMRARPGWIRLVCLSDCRLRAGISARKMCSRWLRRSRNCGPSRCHGPANAHESG